MAKAHAHYQAILNERGAATLQTSLKVSSGANGFKVMDPFDWTKDKSIYQRWQLWSEKARLTLDAMEGDSEKTKISYTPGSQKSTRKNFGNSVADISILGHPQIYKYKYISINRGKSPTTSH